MTTSSPISPSSVAITRRLRPLALAIAAASLSATALPLAAQTSAVLTDVREFSIAAGSLDDALGQFGRQSGVLVSVNATLTKNLRSPGVSGRLPITAALQQVLAGSGLEAVHQPDGTVTLRQLPAQGAAVLPTMKIRASAAQDSTGPVQGYVANRSASGTKTDTALNEVPQSLSIVTRDAMNVRGVTSLAEALAYTPGFTAYTYGQDDRYDWSVMRGIGSTYNNNYRDGLKDKGGAYAVPRLNAYGVERVEYLRGPASILFGSMTPGGAINSVTKRPTATAQGEIRLRAGNFDRQGIAADSSGPLDGDGVFLYRLVASTEQFDLVTPQTDKREDYFAPALTIRPNDDTQLTLLANYQPMRVDGRAYPYSYYVPWGGYISAQEKGWDRFDLDQWSASILLDHRINDSLSFHSRTRYGETELDYRLASANNFLSETVVQRIAVSYQDDARMWQTDNYFEAKWGNEGWTHTTIAGVDLSKVSGDLLRGLANPTNPYDLVAGKGVGAFIEPELEPFSTTEDRQTGVYIQNQARINDTYVLLAGLRHDSYRAEGSNPSDDDKLTGRIGGVWLLARGISPYISYSMSFQPESGTTFDGSPFKPTEGRQYEIGVRYEPVGTNARFAAALFDIKQQNVLTIDPLHEDFSIQRGEIGSRGLELEANMSLSNRLDLTASYSYTDARVTKDTDSSIVGRDSAFVPRDAANLWLDYQFPITLLGGHVDAGMGARYHSRVLGDDYVTWVSGATLFDLRVGYTLDRWELSVNAQNLFDKKWLTSCGYDYCTPGDQREVVATLNYRW